jgi:hypothetical protein
MQKARARKSNVREAYRRCEMGRCGECRWWTDYGLRHKDAFNGACEYFKHYPETAKGCVEECDADFGCVCFEKREVSE